MASVVRSFLRAAWQGWSEACLYEGSGFGDRRWHASGAVPLCREEGMRVGLTRAMSVLSLLRSGA